MTEIDISVVGTYCGECEAFSYDDDEGNCDECGEPK